MTLAPPPCADAQLSFLSKVQRLFNEGDFTATYKCALLIALADLAVELGKDDGDELFLTLRQIAERFVQLYWRQATPYGIGRPSAEPAVLSQNLGIQAAVVAEIADFRATCGVMSPQAARSHPRYGALVSSVGATVSAQPLARLQNFGGITDKFLYDRSAKGAISLKPGVAYCLRRFHSLIQQLARTRWIGHVKANTRNHCVLGNADDLEDFLFATPRQSLLLLGAGLRKIDGAKCFYCGDVLAACDVDHFMPFSLYSRDLAHNFVLAHAKCNRSKSDSLAARPHLEHWLERLLRHKDDISELGQKVGIVVDSAVCHQVAGWGYSSAKAGGGHAWMHERRYEPIDDGYTGLLGAGRTSAGI